MEYAVIETGGKQYKVKNGMVLEMERINGLKDSVLFDKVLLYVKDSEVVLGRPYLDNIKITGKLLGEVKGQKIRVARFKAKSRYRKVSGHRHIFSRVEILKIVESPKNEAKGKK